MNRAIQADVTNKHAYRNISLLLTHGFHHHEINNDYDNSAPRLDPSVDFRLRLDHVRLRVRAPIRLQLGVLGRLRFRATGHNLHRATTSSYGPAPTPSTGWLCYCQGASPPQRLAGNLPLAEVASPYRPYPCRLVDFAAAKSTTAPRLPRSNQARILKNIKHTLCFICNPAAMDDIVLQSRRSSPCCLRHQRVS